MIKLSEYNNWVWTALETGKKHTKGREDMNTLKTSIRKKVERPLKLLMTTAIVLLGIISLLLNFMGTRATLERNLPVLAEFASQAIGKELTAITNVVEISGTIARLSNAENAWESKKEILDGFQQKYDWVEYILSDAQGKDVSPNNAQCDLDMHRQAQTGEVVIADPVWNNELGIFTITVCAPLWNGGLRN